MDNYELPDENSVGKLIDVTMLPDDIKSEKPQDIVNIMDSTINVDKNNLNNNFDDSLDMHDVSNICDEKFDLLEMTYDNSQISDNNSAISDSPLNTSVIQNKNITDNDNINSDKDQIIQITSSMNKDELTQKESDKINDEKHYDNMKNDISQSNDDNKSVMDTTTSSNDDSQLNQTVFEISDKSFKKSDSVEDIADKLSEQFSGAIISNEIEQQEPFIAKPVEEEKHVEKSLDQVESNPAPSSNDSNTEKSSAVVSEILLSEPSTIIPEAISAQESNPFTSENLNVVEHDNPVELNEKQDKPIDISSTSIDIKSVVDAPESASKGVGEINSDNLMSDASTFPPMIKKESENNQSNAFVVDYDTSAAAAAVVEEAIATAKTVSSNMMNADFMTTSAPMKNLSSSVDNNDDNDSNDKVTNIIDNNSSEKPVSSSSVLSEPLSEVNDDRISKEKEQLVKSDSLSDVQQQHQQQQQQNFENEEKIQEQQSFLPSSSVTSSSSPSPTPVKSDIIEQEQELSNITKIINNNNNQSEIKEESSSVDISENSTPSCTDFEPKQQQYSSELKKEEEIEDQQQKSQYEQLEDNQQQQPIQQPIQNPIENIETKMGKKNYRQYSNDSSSVNNSEPDCLQNFIQTLFGQCVADILYWRDPKNSGVVFGIGLIILFSLTIFSVISVIAYTLLFTLLASLSFRVYKNVMQAVNKTDEGHPFKEYLDLDLAPSQERTHEIADQLLSHYNCFIKRMRSVLLVEDYVESFKYLFMFWALTFIGAWFNGMTLVIMAYVGAFSVPKIYEMNQAQIDQYINLVVTKMNELTERIPFLKKPVAEKKDD